MILASSAGEDCSTSGWDVIEEALRHRKSAWTQSDR